MGRGPNKTLHWYRGFEWAPDKTRTVYVVALTSKDAERILRKRLKLVNPGPPIRVDALAFPPPIKGAVIRSAWRAVGQI